MKKLTVAIGKSIFNKIEKFITEGNNFTQIIELTLLLGKSKNKKKPKENIETFTLFVHCVLIIFLALKNYIRSEIPFEFQAFMQLIFRPVQSRWG